MLSKILFCFVFLFTTLFSTYPQINFIQAASAQSEKIEKSISIKEQTLKDIFEKLQPSGPKETLVQLMYRMDVYLKEPAKNELYNTVGQYSNFYVGKIEVKDTEAWFGEGKDKVHLKTFFDEKKNLKIVINGKDFVPSNPASIRATIRDFEKFMGVNFDKQITKFWWFDLLVPKAHAFNWMSLLVPAITVGVVGIGLYMNKKKQKAAQEAAVAAQNAQCGISCCGSPVQNGTGGIVGGSFGTVSGCCAMGSSRVSCGYCVPANADASANAFCPTRGMASTAAPINMSTASAVRATPAQTPITFSPADGQQLRSGASTATPAAIQGQK